MLYKIHSVGNLSAWAQYNNNKELPQYVAYLRDINL